MTIDPQHSTIDYPPEWHTGTIQARIRAQAGHTCEICGLHFDPLTNMAVDQRSEEGYPVFGHVHHLDHYPPNCDDSNLIFLCQVCHIRLHGLGWKPGDELPVSWGNEPPPWILRRNLPYQLNPAVHSLHDSVRFLAEKQERAHFLISLLEREGWVSGTYDRLSEMRGFLNFVLTEYEALLAERTQVARQPVLEQAQAWARENGFLPYAEAIRHSGLVAFDFDAAVEQGILQPEPCPFADAALPLYFDSRKIVLDPAVIQTLWSTMRLTPEQAAGVLGISTRLFAHLCRQAALKPLPAQRTLGRRPEPLYRRTDVEKLRSKAQVK